MNGGGEPASGPQEQGGDPVWAPQGRPLPEPPSQPPPPATSSRRGLPAAVAMVTVLVAVVVTGGALSGTGGDLSGGDSAAGKLTAAAERLTSARAVNLHGTVSSGADRLDGDLTVTRDGWVTGDVTWNGRTAQVIMPGDRVYVRAGRDFWHAEARVADTAAWIGGSRWGRFDHSSMGPAVREDMNPSAIATDLRDVTRDGVMSTVRASVRGIPALKITTRPGTVYYVSADDAPRLLRLENALRTAVDVLEPGGAGAEAVTELRGRINALKDSFDPSRDTRVDKVAFGGCTASGCTVNSKVWAERTGDVPIRVTVFVRITANDKKGQKLGECNNSGTVTSSSAINVTCRVESAAWSRFRGGPGPRRWLGNAEAMANGATSTEIKTMLNGLSRL